MAKVRANRLGLLAFLAFHVFSGLAAAQIRISGLPETRVVEVWQDKGQLFLKGEDGRLYSVPLSTLEGQDIEGITAEDINRGLTRSPNAVPSVAEVLELLRAGISEETIRTFVRGKRGRYSLSTDDLLELKQAGASEEFLQFLIRAGGKRQFFRAYNGPPRDRSQDVVAAPEPAYTDPAPAGIPLYPYVYPGYYSYYGYGSRSPYGSLRGVRNHRGHRRGKVHGGRKVSRHHAQGVKGGRPSFRRSGRRATHHVAASRRAPSRVGAVSPSTVGRRSTFSIPRAMGRSRVSPSRGLMGLTGKTGKTGRPR